MPRAINLAKPLPNYVSAAVALSFAGFLNGYDTGCIGSIAHMRQFADTVGDLSPTVLGITVSMILLTGIVPALFGGHFADKHGRLRLILPGAALFGLGALLQGTAFGLAQFITGRAISGAGQGIFLANVSVYITEIAPQRRRGRLSAMPQFLTTLGVCVGYFSCYSTSGLPSSLAWRLPYIVQVLVSTFLSLVCLTLPESPRWLLLKGRGQEAQRALELLDFDMDEARRDFLNSPQEQPSLPTWQSFTLLLGPAYRQRTLLSLFILSVTQLSGIDAITYYAPALFAQAGITGNSTSLIASGVASITMFAVSIPAFLLADKWGRRTSTIAGGLGLSSIMLLIGSLYAAGAVYTNSVARWTVVVCVFLFGMVFCATWGIVSKIYASEIQPANTRAAGNSLGMASSFFTNWLVALITPILLGASAYGAYFLFGGIVLISAVVLTVYMPETRGRSLESIQSEFRRPALRQLFSLVRLFGGRRRQAGSSGSSSSPQPTPEEIELRSRQEEAAANDAEAPVVAAASSISVPSAPLGLRLDVGST